MQPNEATGPCDLWPYNEIVSYPHDATAQLERHLLIAKAEYQRELIVWELDDHNRFVLHLGTFTLHNEEVDEKMVAEYQRTGLAQQYIVTPWQFFLFYYPEGKAANFYCPKGELFTTVRKVTEYCDYFKHGDPVNIVDIATMEVVGSGTVSSVKVTSIKDLDDVDMERLRKGKFYPIEQMSIVHYLELFYQMPVKADEMIALISIRATTDLGEKPVVFKKLSWFQNIQLKIKQHRAWFSAGGMTVGLGHNVSRFGQLHLAGHYLLRLLLSEVH